MAIYSQYENKLKEAIRQVAIMAAYAAGENIYWRNKFTLQGGVCNIKEHGAGLMWEWSSFDYKIAGDENYEEYYR